MPAKRSATLTRKVPLSKVVTASQRPLWLSAMPVADEAAARILALTKLAVPLSTRRTSSSPLGGLLETVTEATARSVPGIGRTENGLPPMATTACGDSKRPMGAVDDEHVNGGIDVWEPGTMAWPQAPSPDISVTRPGRMNRLGDHPRTRMLRIAPFPRPISSRSGTEPIREINSARRSGTRAGDPCLPLSGCRWYGPRQRRVGGDSSPWRTRKAVQSYWLVRGRSHLSEGVCSVPPYSASSTAGTRRLTPYPGSRPLTRAVLRLHGNRWRAAGRCNWRAVHSSRIHSRDRWL